MEAFGIRGVVDIMTGRSMSVLDNVDRKARGTAKTLGSLSDVANNAFKHIAAYAGVSKLISVFAGVVHEAMSFEASMRNLNSIAHLNEGQFSALSDRVRGLATSLNVAASPTETANALYDIMSSGFTDSAAAMEVLTASLRAGAAGLTDAATAARAITAVMNSYGQDTMTAAHVSDVMFQTVNLGVVTFGELASNIGNVTSIASSAGVSFEELAATIATLTTKGIRAPIAITSIRAAISQLTAPSEQARAEMKEFGIHIDANTIKSRGLIGTLVDLGNATGGNAQALKAILGDIDAVNVALSITKDGGVAARAAMEQMSNAGGTSLAALAEQNKSAAAQWANFTASAKAFAVVLGESVLPYIKDFTDALQASVHFFADWNNEFDRLKDDPTWVGFLARAFGGVGDSIGAVKDAMVGWGVIANQVVDKQITDEQTLNTWLIKNKNLRDASAATPGGAPSPNVMGMQATPRELAQANTALRTERIRLAEQQKPYERPQSEWTHEEQVQNMAHGTKPPTVTPADTAEGRVRARRIEQIDQEISMNQKALVVSEQREANAVSTEAQIAAMNAKWGKTDAERIKAASAHAAEIQKGKAAWKEWSELREKQGFGTKREEYSSLTALSTKQTFGAVEQNAIKQSKAKLEREIAEDRVKTNEAADAKILEARVTVQRSWLTYAQQQLESNKSSGTATVADQQRVSDAVLAVAQTERAQKLIVIANAEADLERSGKATVDSARAFAAERVAVEAGYSDTVRAERQRRLAEERTEQTQKIQFNATMAQQASQVNDLEIQRLSTLEGRGMNVEAAMRDAQQERMRLALDALHVQMQADLDSAKSAEQLARVRIRYAGEEALTRKKFAQDEADRQRTAAESQRAKQETLQTEIFHLTHDEKSNEVHDMQKRVEELRRNGFSEVEIAAWVSAKKQDLLKKEGDAIDKLHDKSKESEFGFSQGVQTLDQMVASMNSRFTLSPGASGGGATTSTATGGATAQKTYAEIFGATPGASGAIPAGGASTGTGGLPLPPFFPTSGAAGASSTVARLGGISSPGGGAAGSVASSPAATAGAGPGTLGRGDVTQKVALSIDLNGQIKAVSGPLSKQTVDGLTRDLGLQLRLGGDTTKGLGRT